MTDAGISRHPTMQYFSHYDDIAIFNINTGSYFNDVTEDPGFSGCGLHSAGSLLVWA